MEELIEKYKEEWEKYGMGSGISYSKVIADLKALQKAKEQQPTKDAEEKPFGYHFNGRFYKTEHDLRGKTMSDENQAIPLYVKPQQKNQQGENTAKLNAEDILKKHYNGLAVSDIVRAMEEYASSKTPTEWISVEDRLPEGDDADENGKVLIFRKTNENQKALEKSVMDFKMVKYCDEDTYWTTLPSTEQLKK